ncbi:MAG: hypothetical protein PUF37_07305 [Prevotellaceae bacterium]|nr:hypothetical protein [Prevotellaceae bacterium]
MITPLIILSAVAAAPTDDAKDLGKALEYFTAGKYHECLLILSRLDKHYHLNPRYRAYLATCYYYDWDYKNAVKVFEEAAPSFTNLAPHERSFYYWAWAESLFALQRWQEAIPKYEAMLPVCYDSEQAEAYYRLGYCHLMLKGWDKAHECFLLAQQGYERHTELKNRKARLAQLRNMIRGCEEASIKQKIEGKFGQSK